MNKVLSSGLVLVAMMSLVGCGGSSDSVETASASTPSSNTGSIATGTAFYIDSAVSGVNYKCGTQEGITGADGSFTFEAGQSCTFYLGDMMLRGVDAGLLVDGENVYETDVKIARILQSLDSDGNPANGITIKAETVKALADAGITKLPDTVAEMDEVLAVIAANGGTEVSEGDAAEHMLRTLLVGKTLYQHLKECEEDRVESLDFGEDGHIVMSDEPEPTAYRIEGNIIYTTEDGEEKAHTIVEVTSEYIKINETSGEVTMFYFAREAAQAAPAMDYGECGGSETAFTQALVSANPWYVVENAQEYDGVHTYCSGLFTFDGNGGLNASWNDSGTIGNFTGTYTIDNGKLIIPHDGKVETDTLLTSESNKLTVKAESENAGKINLANNIWFKNKADAEAYLSEHGENSCYN